MWNGLAVIVKGCWGSGRLPRRTWRSRFGRRSLARAAAGDGRRRFGSIADPNAGRWRVTLTDSVGVVAVGRLPAGAGGRDRAQAGARVPRGHGGSPDRDHRSTALHIISRWNGLTWNLNFHVSDSSVYDPLDLS